MTQPPTTPDGPVLRDIHLPPDPSWWPPAPGWWIVAALLLIVVAAGLWWWRRQRRMRAWRRRVLDELDRLARQHVRDGDAGALANGLHQLLRRVARGHDPQAAQQRGEAWQHTLARVPVAPATLQQLLALEQQLYRPPGEFDAAGAINAVRQWLRAALKNGNWKPVATERVDA